MATSRMPTPEEALDFAVRTINRGDLEKGRVVLNWVLQNDPSNVVAWTWMTRCVTDLEALRECQRRISALNPFQTM
jgi:Tfp pilus assembly protein PilF